MQLSKYLCTPESLPIHLQPKWFKFIDNVNVRDFEYGFEF
jgi:hypothetical protein